MPGEVRRILAIDGGGIRGVFPAAFLATIEADLAHPIGKYFDLIVGTSTGGIIALGLGLGMKAAEILRFYEAHGPSIFRAGAAAGFLHYFGAKYTAEPLREALVKVFGDRLLGESQTRLVIPSCNLTTGQVHLWKTAHYARVLDDYKCKVVEIALSTAAAPTYFPTHHTDRGIPLIDGGVWANNPIGVAVVEAVGVLRWDPGALHVLSLGCATAPLDARRAHWSALGRLYWAKKISDVFMAAQSSAALGTAIHLLKDRQQIVREAPVLDKAYTALDSVRDLPILKGLGAERARHRKPDLTEFFTTPAAPFTPLRTAI
jgi:uncharacterized protein